jgi:histidine triad (HIT) family protein
MPHPDCIFCKIVEGKIPSTKVFENDKVIAFKDLHPLALKHFLFIHREHTRDIVDLMESDPEQIKDVYAAISGFAKNEGLTSSGMRVVTNLGAHGGQTVFHTHFHLLGGETLGRFGR